MTTTALGAFNRKIRIANALSQGVSQKQIALDEGVSVQYVSNVKMKYRPTSLHSSLDRARLAQTDTVGERC